MRVLRILVACEKSQAVTIALRALGHLAYSCDIEPCSGGHPEWHLQMDAIQLLQKNWTFFPQWSQEWDLILAFPPCTHLSAAGAARWPEKQQDGRQQAAIDFFMRFINAPCDYIAVENPVGIINTAYRKPDQIINPFNFGDPYRKKTCLWLKGLPKLVYSHPDIPPPPPVGVFKSGPKKGRNRHWYDSLPWNKNRAEIRSRTFPGIAREMAKQWTDFILSL